MLQRRHDCGETLVEIIITIVLVTIAVTALITSLATVSANANSHRNDVIADTILRNYAEATKLAVQSCTFTSSGVPNTYKVLLPTPPTGFVVQPLPGVETACPPKVTPIGTLSLIVAGPGGLSRHLDIKVRTP